MTTLWPWLALAGLGALHGASPANGWMFAAACGLRARDGARARQALLPIAIGHVASIAIVVFAVAQGVLMDRALVQRVAGALLICVTAYRVLQGTGRRTPAGAHIAANRTAAHTGHAGIALWSCLMTTAHGAGLMLVPALVPLCMADNPARAITASGSLVLALAAVGVHMGAMLITTGVIATGVCRGVARHPDLMRGAALRHAWTATMAIAGASMVTSGWIPA